jgi:hypothetical protein
MTSSDFDNLIASFASDMAHQRNESVAELWPIVRVLFDVLQREYCALGAPDGDTAEGFAVWLFWQLRLVSAA